MPTQRGGQSPVIALLKAMGYKGDEEGMCYGFSHMMIQAILAGDLESATTRLDYIYQHSVDEIVTALNLAREEEKRMPKKPSFPMTIDEAEEIDQRRKLLEFCAFMEGLELYQHPYYHQEFFSQDKKTNTQRGIKSASLTKPMRADDLYEVKRFAGVYDEKELESYFDNLRQITKSHAFAMELNSVDHSVAVAYDPGKGWYFIDANHSPIVIKVAEEKFKETMKTYVMEAFYSGNANGYAAFSSTIYTNAADKQNTEAMVRELDSRPEWRRIHATGGKNKINAQDSNGTTLTYLYSVIGDSNEVKKLIDAGADINIPRKSLKITPLLTAIDHSFDAVVDVLLACDRLTVNSFGVQGYSPLSLAIIRGNNDLVEKLLRKGADPNYKNPANGNTALHKAFERNDPYSIRELLKIGARADIPNDKNASTLMLAAEYNKMDVISTIMTYSTPWININQPQNKYNMTILHTAAVHGHIEMCEKLIKLGADVNAVTVKGCTPLNVILTLGQRNTDIMLLLLKNNADPNIADNNGNTPMHNAVKKGNIRAIQLLIEAKGIDLTAKNRDGKTAADLTSNPEIKQSLINAANPNKAEVLPGTANTERKPSFWSDIKIDDIDTAKPVIPAPKQHK